MLKLEQIDNLVNNPDVNSVCVCVCVCVCVRERERERERESVQRRNLMKCKWYMLLVIYSGINPSLGS
jgi:hypothetical protein